MAHRFRSIHEKTPINRSPNGRNKLLLVRGRAAARPYHLDAILKNHFRWNYRA